MEAENKTPILEVAWTRYAHFDAASNERSRGNNRLRKWVAILGVLATLFALLTEVYPQSFPATPGVVLKVLLISTPIVSSVLAAFINKFYGSGDWLVMRAGAEQILKEIFTYRTILQKSSGRGSWLESRLTDIQHQIFSGLGGEMVLKPYKGPLPPYDDPNDPTDDAGFSDLTGEQYFKFRVESQLAWHLNKVNQFQSERTRLQIFILVAGGAGSLLAALGGPFSLWVALTASLTTALIGWQELRNLDYTLKNYSKVVVELMAIYDHWENLDANGRTDAEFYAMVRNTEDLLWTQNVEYIKAMQSALSKVGKADDSLVEDAINKSIDEDARFKQSLKDAAAQEITNARQVAEQSLTEDSKKNIASLTDEISSPIVQAELAAMEKVAAQVVQAVANGSTLASTLQSIAADFAGVDLNGNTSAKVLNSLLSRYPATQEPKG